MKQVITEQLVNGIDVRYMNKSPSTVTFLSLQTFHYYQQANAIEYKTRHFDINLEEVSWKLNIEIEKAKDTLRVKMQKGIRHAVHPLNHRHQVNHMKFNMKRFNVQFYTNHILNKDKSLEGNKVLWMYMTGKFTVL